MVDCVSNSKLKFRVMKVSLIRDGRELAWHRTRVEWEEKKWVTGRTLGERFEEQGQTLKSAISHGCVLKMMKLHILGKKRIPLTRETHLVQGSNFRTIP